MSLAVACNRNDAAFDLISVYCEFLDALAYVIRVLDLDIVYVASELTLYLESVPS